MKLELTELRHLFMIIDKAIADSNIPKQKHKKMAKAMKDFAQQGFLLGKNGKIEIEATDDISK